VIHGEGVVINEAMATFNAIIALHKVGSAYDLVKDNYNWETFKSKNIKDLNKRINFFFRK
jgi:hypothetical protein